MISVKPDNAAGRTLALVVAYPGQLDTRAIGRHLCPAPKRRTPFLSWGDRVLWRESCEIRGEESAVMASAALEGLRRRKLVELRGSPRISTAFIARADRVGLRLALDYAALGARVRVKPRKRHADLVARADRTGSLPPYEEIAAMGRAAAEAYRELVAIDVIIPPSFRWPSAAGIELVESWSTP